MRKLIVTLVAACGIGLVVLSVLGALGTAADRNGWWWE